MREQKVFLQCVGMATYGILRSCNKNSLFQRRHICYLQYAHKVSECPCQYLQQTKGLVMLLSAVKSMGDILMLILKPERESQDLVFKATYSD